MIHKHVHLQGNPPKSPNILSADIMSQVEKFTPNVTNCGQNMGTLNTMYILTFILHTSAHMKHNEFCLETWVCSQEISLCICVNIPHWGKKSEISNTSSSSLLDKRNATHAGMYYVYIETHACKFICT